MRTQQVGVLLLFCISVIGQEIWLQKEYQQMIDTIGNTEMGATILEEIQMELDSPRGLAEIVAQFNLMEKNLVTEEQEDVEKQQENAEKLSQQKQEIQDAIAETQYSTSILGERIVEITEARGHYANRLDEKDYLMSEYQKLVEQLEAIRQEENDRFNSNRDEILNTVDIVKRARYLIAQLEPKMPKDKVLVQQTQFLEEQNDQDKTFVQLKSLHQEGVDQLGEKNPYVQILSAFVQTTGFIKKEEVQSMVAILTSLYDDLMDTNNNMFQAENERQTNFEKVKERCEQEMATWEQQAADINALIESDKQTQADLETRRQQQLSKLDSLQRQADDVQTLIEDDKIAYNERKKDREEYLRLLRKIKSVLQADFDGAKQYIINKKLQD